MKMVETVMINNGLVYRKNISNICQLKVICSKHKNKSCDRRNYLKDKNRLLNRMVLKCFIFI